MRVYIKDYLSRNKDDTLITSAFHHIEKRVDGEGYLIGLFSVRSKGDLDSSNIAKFIWNGLLQEFLENEGGSIEKLKSTLRKGESKLLELIKHDPTAEEGVGLDFALLHFYDGMLYFGVWGGTHIRILHESELVNVSEILRENKVNCGSTVIGDDDIVIVSSPDFQFESSTDPQTLLENLEDNEYSLGSGALLASLGVNFNQLLADAAAADGIEIVDSEESVEEAANEATVEPDHSIPTIAPAPLPTSAAEPQISEEKPTEAQLDDRPVVPEPISTEEKAVESLPTPVEAKTSDASSHVRPINRIPEPPTRAEQLSFANRESSSEPLTGKDKLTQAKRKVKGSLRAAHIKATPTINRIQEKLSRSTQNFRAWVSRFLMNRYGRKAWFKKMSARFSQSKISARRRASNLHLGDYKVKSLRNKRFMMLGSFIAIALLLYFGARATQSVKAQREMNAQFRKFHEEVNDTLARAKDKALTDPETAELALSKVQSILNQYQFDKEKLRDADLEKFKQIEGEVLGVNDLLGKVVSVKEEENLTLFYDIRLNHSNAVAEDIAIYRDENGTEYLLITDSGNKAAYTIPIHDKSAKKIPDSNSILKQPKFVDIGELGIYIYDPKVGVVFSEFNDGRGSNKDWSVLSGVLHDDFPIDEADELAILTQSDNIYLMDSEGAKIYKSNRTTSGGYAIPSVYVEDPSLSQITDFFADFSAYVTTRQKPGLHRFIFDYERGVLVPSPLTISGARAEVSNITAGYTSGSLEQKLYLFEESESKVMAFEKPNEAEGLHPNEMLLKAQYVYRGSRDDVFKDVKDIVVDAQESSLFLLDGQKIWQVKLK